jgi:hypothetical protein
MPKLERIFKSSKSLKGSIPFNCKYYKQVQNECFAVIIYALSFTFCVKKNATLSSSIFQLIKYNYSLKLVV